MLEIFTIICKDDYKLWRLQAKSIARFSKNNDVLAVHIVVNELDDIAEKVERFVNENIDSYGHMNDRVKFHKRSVFLDRDLNLGGWKIQQLIKMRCYRVLEEESVLILDAKNHFIRPISRYDYFEEGSEKPIVSLNVRGPRHSQFEWLVDSLAVVGLPKELARGPASQTTTPYPATKSLLKELDEYISQKYSSLENFFEEHAGKASEFLMIFSYALKKYKDPELYFKSDELRSATIFRRHPPKPEQVLALIDAAKQGLTAMFAIHSGRIPNLDKQERRHIEDMWVSLGIASKEDCQEILGAGEEVA